MYQNSLSKISMVAILVFAITFSGCATIVSKSSYPVRITSDPEGAKVKIYDNKNRAVDSGTTPMTTTLPTSAGFFQGQNYRIECEKAGYDKGVTTIGRHIDPWYLLGNFVFGGLIGYIVIDPATGAMWKLDESAHVNMEPSNTNAGVKIIHAI